MEIHLIAPKDKSQWRDVWRHCYKFWENSSYKINLWDDDRIDDLIREDDDNIFRILNQLPPIYKYDFVRYIFLEKFGGAYFDMDVEINIDFLPYLNTNTIYLSEGQPFEDEQIKTEFEGKLPPEFFDINETPVDWELSNHIMISPKNPHIWGLIKNKIKLNIIKHYRFDKGDFLPVLKIAGPVALSRIVNEIGLNYKLLSYYHFDVDTNDEEGFTICKHHKTFNWVKLAP